MKRFLKICFWIVLVLIVVCMAGIVLFWKFFPEKKIIALIENRSESAGMPVRVQSVIWKFPARFEVRQIRVWGGEWQKLDSEPFFSVNRISVKCKLLPLLRRRLEIAEVQIDEPRIALDSTFFNLQMKPKKEKPKAVLEPLPLSFGLLHLGLDRFRLRMTMPAGLSGSELVLDGLNLDVSGVRVPRKWIGSPDAVRGSVRAFTDRATLWIRSAGMEFHLLPELNLEFKWLKDKRWNLDGTAGIRPAEKPGQKGFLFDIAMVGSGYGDSVSIRESALSLGNEVLVRLAGRAFRTRNTMEFRIQAQSQASDLSALKQAAESLLPDSLAKPLSRFNVRGIANVLQGEVWGNVSGFQFRFESVLQNASLINQVPPFSVQNGGIHLVSSGKWTPRGFENTGITGNGRIGRISIQINDTTAFPIRDLSAEWNVRTDNRLMPRRGQLTGSVGDLLKGRVLFRLNMGSGNAAVFRPEDILLDGEARADSMDMAFLPNRPAGFGGACSSLIQLKADGPKNVRLSVTVKSPGMQYPFQGKPESTPPLSIRADAFCHTQMPFLVWVMDSALVRSEDLFFARASGKADLKRSNFDFSIDRATLRNDPIVPFLPKPVAEQMKGLKLFGNETLTLRVRGEGMGQNLRIRMDGNLAIDQTGLALPEQAIGVEGIHGEVTIGGALEKLRGIGSISVPNVFLDQVRTTPLKDNQIRFGWSARWPDSVRIEDGVVEIPSLRTSGKFHLEMGLQSKAPSMALSVEAGLNSPDPLEVMRGLSISGKAFCQMHVSILDPGKQRFQISGLVKSESLSVFQQKQVEVRNVFCSVPFELGLDLLEKRVLKKEDYKPVSWLNYESDRELLRHSGAGLENVRIEKVVVLDYSINTILLDLHFRDGMIDIPWFSAGLLSGNVGGNLWFDSNTGIPQDMTYLIRAQASRINSAQLKGLGIQTGEETELDATLAFAGRGVDPNKGLDIEGSFHITQIGPKFASTLLEQMDSKGSDRSIRLTRRLLNAGWKPKLLSFELRHGYVYPSLVLDQPWFSPLRIPDKVEYGRLPLEFFLKQKSMFQIK